MASAYPAGLDTFATNKANATATTTDHPTHHNDLADAVNKIEAELGTDPAGADATVKARLDGLDSDIAAIAPRYVWPYVAPTLSGAYDDPLTSDTSANYTATTPNGTATWTFAAGGLTVAFASQASAEFAVNTKAAAGLAIGDYVEAKFAGWGAYDQYTIIGVCLADGTTTGSNMIAGGFFFGQDGNPPIWFSAEGTITTITNFTNRGTANFNMGGPPGVRLMWSAANTFQVFYSLDGVNWSQVGADRSFTLTPTRLGFAVSTYGAATTHRAAYSYLKSNATP